MTAPRRFRKRPVEIEARQFLTEDDGQQIAAWIRSHHGDDSAFWFADGPEGPRIVIHTLEGAMIASLGDWIIRGVQGEFYPCKPDIFAETYDDPGVTVGVRSATATVEVRVIAEGQPHPEGFNLGTVYLVAPPQDVADVRAVVARALRDGPTG